MEIKKLVLRSAGMFSNVNEVIQQLYLAEQNNYKFLIDWSNSCYRDPQRMEDTWNYYFKDCFTGLYTNNDSLQLVLGGVSVACSKDNIITPRLIDGNCVPLLLPKDRNIPHRIIECYIEPMSHIKNIIDSYKKRNFDGYIIGLHIRGPGRIDGGASGIRCRYPNKSGVPFGQYFKFVDLQLTANPNACIFVCSDSSFVMHEIMQRYGNRTIKYTSTRSAFGEMHAFGHPANAGKTFQPYKLGEDVLVEAYLLSSVDYFVHGNSNVVNFVLSNNPDLKHKYVYETV